MHRRTNSIVVSDDGDEVELQSGMMTILYDHNKFCRIILPDLHADEYLDDVNDFLEKHRTEYTKSNESLKQRELGNDILDQYHGYFFSLQHNCVNYNHALSL